MKEVSMYIHIPFCKQKCLYCDFTSFSGSESYMEEYCTMLAKEISMHKDKIIKTIFIGGGTPTYLSLKGLNILKESIDNLTKSKDLEFTVEGNPGTFSEDKLLLLKSMGVNRLSIGLQACQNDLLKKIGRIHSKEEFIKSFNMARKLGFNNVNVDLMFGLPNQKLQDWKETLEEVTSLKPEHLSCYSLIVEEGTPFYKMHEKGLLNTPSEEEEREMYNTTLEYLSEKAYNQYEISNFSKKNMECRHNLVYWNLEEYIGCGVSAHSFIDGYRLENAETIKEYIHKISIGEEPIIHKHKNSPKETMEEFMFMGLRKIQGIRKKDFIRRFNRDIYEIYGEIINKYIKLNLIVDRDECIQLTSKGIELSNLVMADFILD